MMVADVPMSQMRVAGVIRRRELLQRDPPVDWRAECAVILAVYSVAEAVWILNVARSSFVRWAEGTVPNFEDGQAVRKLADRCRAEMTL